MEITELIFKKYNLPTLAEGEIIESIEEGINLVGNLYFQGFDKVIIKQSQFSDNFFDLHSGMAGEIL